MKEILTKKDEDVVNVRFESEQSLSVLADNLGLSRDDLQWMYNQIPGAPPTKRLRNRPTAIAAIWKALPDIPAPVKHREGMTKKDQIIAAMKDGGRSLCQLVELTDWQPHTIRARIATWRLAGIINVTKNKKDGVTVYEVAE